MPRNAADILVDTLTAWDVDTVFGLAGDGVNGLVEALRQAQGRIRYVPVMHEESAAFMATAHAKMTGRIGCCLATTGPGGLHLLTGLYDAKLDLVPVVAITGLPYHDLAGTWTQQDVALDRVLADVAVFSERVMGAAHVESMASLACRKALAGPGVAHLAVPVDVQEEHEADDERSPRNRRHAVSNVPAAGLRVADNDALDRAADRLNRAQRVAILAGRGALGARDLLERTAELLAAPVAKALLGKAVLPDGHPHDMGGIGLYGTLGTHAAIEGCDALLIVGSTFPYLEYYPDPARAVGIQIDRDPNRIALRFPVEIGLVGDARPTLEALCARLERKADRSFLEHCHGEARRWDGLLAAAEATRDRMAMHPAVPVAELGRRLPDRAILITDSGHHTGLAARHIRLREGMDFACSGALASMASGVPYAIAAALACPGRPVVAVVGDGGLGMQLGEFATAVRLRLPILVLVLRNGTLGQIKWEQMLFLGNPEFGCAVPPIDFARCAEAMGARGLTVARADEAGDVLDSAFAMLGRDSGPVLVQADVDPNEPLLPAKVSATYARHLHAALDKGTPGADEVRAALQREPNRTQMASAEVEAEAG